jgi:hypothetical protein
MARMMKVAIVDDEADMRQSISQWLALSGFGFPWGDSAAAIGVADPAHAGPVPTGEQFLGMGGTADAAAEDCDGNLVNRGTHGRSVVGPARAPPSPLPHERCQGRATGDGPAPCEPFPSHRVPLTKKTNLGDVSVSPSAPRSACHGRRPASAGH